MSPSVSSPLWRPRIQTAVLVAAVALFVSPVALPDPLHLGTQLTWALVGLAAASLICIPELLAGRWPSSRVDALVGIYLLLAAFSSVSGADRWLTLKGDAVLVSQLALFYSALIVARARPSAVPRILLIVIVGASLVELIGFAYHLEVGLRTRPKEYPMPPGWSGYPELGALGTMLFGILAGILLMAVRRIDRIALTGLVLIAGVEMLALFSRGAWLAALVVAAVLLVLAGTRRTHVIGAAVALGGVVIVIGLLNPSVRALAGNLVGIRTPAGAPYIEMAAPSSRIALWTKTTRMIRDYPLQGVGPGNFRPIFEGRYNPELNDDLRRGEHAHNLWLQQTAELGIPGGLAFGVLWVWLLWMAWRLARDRGGLAAAICLALIGTTVSNVVDNVAIMVAGFRIYLLTWVLFGFVAAMVDDRSAAGRHDPARLPENLIVP